MKRGRFGGWFSLRACGETWEGGGGWGRKNGFLDFIYILGATKMGETSDEKFFQAA